MWTGLRICFRMGGTGSNPLNAYSWSAQKSLRRLRIAPAGVEYQSEVLLAFSISTLHSAGISASLMVTSSLVPSTKLEFNNGRGITKALGYIVFSRRMQSPPGCEAALVKVVSTNTEVANFNFCQQSHRISALAACYLSSVRLVTAWRDPIGRTSTFSFRLCLGRRQRQEYLEPRIAWL